MKWSTEKGFHFLDREALALTALIACSSFVADAVLSALLVDDRVPIIFDELQQEMAWEVDYVEQMDEPVIGFIAKTCGMNAKLLRDQTNSSALIQAGFFLSENSCSDEASMVHLAKTTCRSPGRACCCSTTSRGNIGQDMGFARTWIFQAIAQEGPEVAWHG